MKLHTLALVAGLMMSSGASANVTLNLTGSTNLGNFDAPKSWSETFEVGTKGNIIHNLGFTITEPLFGGSGVANIPLNWDLGGGITVSFTDITNLSAEIFDSNNDSYVSFAKATTGYLILPVSTYFGVGTYTLKITGNAVGTGNPAGMYVIGAVTAPVPEPETWGMLLAGVGLIGLRMRQRRHASRHAAIS